MLLYVGSGDIGSLSKYSTMARTLSYWSWAISTSRSCCHAAAADHFETAKTSTFQLLHRLTSSCASMHHVA